MFFQKIFYNLEYLNFKMNIFTSRHNLLVYSLKIKSRHFSLIYYLFTDFYIPKKFNIFMVFNYSKQLKKTTVAMATDTGCPLNRRALGLLQALFFIHLRCQFLHHQPSNQSEFHLFVLLFLSSMTEFLIVKFFYHSIRNNFIIFTQQLFFHI